MKLKILFITRNFPPTVGGLEKYSYDLISEFEAHDNVHKIALTKSKRHLIWFLPYCLLRALYLRWKHRIRLIHLCDGLLAPIAIVLKFTTGAKVSISIHGLDITYRNPLYQRIIPWCVSRLDKVICVSRSTRDECTRRGIPGRKVNVIPNGIRPNELYMAESKGDLRSRLERVANTSLGNKLVLATIGHLVKRKGVAWFVGNVLPELRIPYVYLVAGDGPEYKQIREVMKRYSLQDRVILLGEVPDEVRNLIYNASDLFIMPNITVPNDVEGFGIVAIEAGSCGLPVIASNIQGIADAVLDGKTGYIVDEQDVEAFLEKIKGTNLQKERIRTTIINTFDWKQIYKRYREVLSRLE